MLCFLLRIRRAPLRAGGATGALTLRLASGLAEELARKLLGEPGSQVLLGMKSPGLCARRAQLVQTDTPCARIS